MDDLDNQHIGDYERIDAETEKELDMKTRIPAIAKAEVEKDYGTASEVIEEEEGTNPNKPKIDNNAKGKSIAE